MDQTLIFAHIGDLYLSSRDKDAQIAQLEARVAELEKQLENGADVDSALQ